MSTGETSGPIHPTPTRRNHYRYLFYAKHHGQGGTDAAQWLPTLSHDEEFTVFDDADLHDVSDERGWLYGVRRSSDGHLLELGTWEQQVAEFPSARPNEPWHGYPLWPLKEAGPQNRKGEKHRPAKAVFQKMVEANLISERDRRRFQKEDHA